MNDDELVVPPRPMMKGPPVMLRPRASIRYATFALVSAFALPTTATAFSPEATDSPAATEPKEASRQVYVRVRSKVGENDDTIQDEVMRAATTAFESEGFVLSDDAPAMVYIVVSHPPDDAASYTIDFGFSATADDALQRAETIACEMCAAGDLLQQVEEGARRLAQRLSGPVTAAAPTDDTGTDSAADEETTGASKPSGEAAPFKSRPDGFGLKWAGMITTIAGCTVLIPATSSNVGRVAISDGSGVPYVWAIAGAGGAVAITGAIMWAVGEKRIKASRSRVSFAPGPHGPMLTLSGRF